VKEFISVVYREVPRIVPLSFLSDLSTLHGSINDHNLKQGKPMKSYILVANSSVATLYHCENLRTKPLVVVKNFEHPESRRKGMDLASDADGHYQTDHNCRASYSEKTSPKEYEAERFAKELIDAIKALNLSAQSTEKLIIVVPAHFHGVMKKHFGTHFPQSSDIMKDYTKLDVRTLLERLREYLFSK
jgi:protein required for attachment to host cells